MTIGSILILKKMIESASSCDFPTIAGPTPMDKRPIGVAQNVLNSRKAKRKLKKINLKIGD
jgi:hypothetical protein